MGSLRSVNRQKKPRGSTARPNGCVDQLSHSFCGSFNEAERNDFLEQRPRHYEPRTFFCFSSGEAAPTHYSPITIHRRFPPIYGFTLFPFAPVQNQAPHTFFMVQTPCLLGKVVTSTPAHVSLRSPSQAHRSSDSFGKGAASGGDEVFLRYRTCSKTNTASTPMTNPLPISGTRTGGSAPLTSGGM